MSIYDPSQYSNLREYVEAVQGSPIDYSNPNQQSILNAAISAMYGGGDTSGLQSLVPAAAPAPTPAPTPVAAPAPAAAPYQDP